MNPPKHFSQFISHLNNLRSLGINFHPCQSSQINLMLAAEIRQFFSRTPWCSRMRLRNRQTSVNPKCLFTFFYLNGDNAQPGQLCLPLIADTNHYQIMLRANDLRPCWYPSSIKSEIMMITARRRIEFNAKDMALFKLVFRDLGSSLARE